jgi:hypothetical protein
MIIERSALRAAMVHVYRLLKGRTPPSLSAAELEQRWVKSGIRRADLTVAMREMRHRHLIDERGMGPETVYSLTPRGISEYSRLRGNLLARAADWITLLHIRLRSLRSRCRQTDPGRQRVADRRISPRLPAG